MSARMLLAIVLPCLLVSAGASGPQSVATVHLSHPERTAVRTFTHVAGVRALSDGRTIVLDSYEQSVLLLDSSWSSVQQVGRRGEGPGEYADPAYLFGMGGDSSGVLERYTPRFLVIDAAGKPGGFLNLRGPEVCSVRTGPFLARVSATDARGWFYGQAQPVAVSPDGGFMVSDSAAIERWRPASCDRDTVAFVPSGLQPGVRLVGTVLMGGGFTPPFAPSTEWTVSQRGRLAIVHLDPYRVTFVEPDGARHEGMAIPFDRVRLSEQHKEEWRRERRRPRPFLMVMRRGERPPTTQFISVPPNEPNEWPRYLPPFLKGAVQFALDGRLWVERTVAAGQPLTFDVIDATGRVVQRVEIPGAARLVGFGLGTLYVVRRDELDQEFLERYRLPT